MRFFLTALAAASLLSAPAAFAHGNNGHVWVTYGGADAMHDCVAKAWLAHDDYRNIAAIASTFPDGGYVTGSYGEPAHWEPFTQAYIDHLRAKYHDDYSSPEARQSVAFLMGASAHGMEDEVFDSIFLREMEEKDGVGQDYSDPGTDFMLIVDGYTRMQPEVFIPKDDPEAALRKIGVDADPKDFLRGMNTIQIAVLGLVNDPSPDLDDGYRPAMTWSAAHYVEFATPGSFHFEMSVIGPYFDALWHRLHGDFRAEDVVVQTVPAPGQRLIANEPSSVFAWTSLIFGYGVKLASLNGDTVRVFDAAGNRVSVDIINTRWNADPTRMIQLRPASPWKADAEYVMKLLPGVEMVDGNKLAAPLAFTFRTACDGACATLAQPVTAATCALPREETAPAVESRGGCASAGAAVPLGLLVPLLRRRRRT